MVADPAYDERLLEGEDPDTVYPEDARHWIAVYRELIAFKTGVLARVRAQVRKQPPAARHESEPDIAILEEQLARYVRRLEFWYARQWNLEGLVIDHDSRRITFRDRSVMLTKREHQLFTALVSTSPGYTRAEQLLVRAWHDSGLPEETLRTYIVRLRAKLAELGVHGEIHNRPRHGYAIVFRNLAEVQRLQPETTAAES